MSEYNPEELFQLENGRYITSVELSDKMRYIKEHHPETFTQENSTGYSWDEAGMADLFSECYNHDTRYCPEAKSWYTYDHGKWQKDVGSLLVSAKIKEFTRLMSLYCGEIMDEEKRKEYMKFVSKMGDRRFRDRMMKDAADAMCIGAEEFDRNPYLINCLNGTYDLERMEFHEHNWEDFITLQTNFNYTQQEDVTCQRWETFIREVTQGDKDKADYLQRALGYSILGTSKEECMFILHGKTTRNGKSTLLNAIEHLLGDYSSVAPVELICRSDRSKNAEAASPVLAKLKGKRFVTMAESDTMSKMDESTIKQYTGGEQITARELYQSAITFTPQFTLWLSCNDLPAVRDKSLFASDRIRLIEFNRHFTDAEQDKGLKAYFETDEAMKGIFTWLVTGLFKYKRFGLTMAESLKAPIRQYERDNDLVLQFLEEKCEQDAESVTRAKSLYDTYKIWCKSNGYYVCSMKKFNAEVTMHPEWYNEKGMSNGVTVYKGLKLR